MRDDFVYKARSSSVLCRSAHLREIRKNKNGFFEKLPFPISGLVLLLLFIAPSFAGPSIQVTDGEISDICSKTKNPSFCEAVLKSSPGVGTADLPGLAKIT